MKRAFRVLLACLMLTGAVHAHGQAVRSPAEAFEAGRAFGNDGKQRAGSKISEESALSEVPGYQSSVPESGHFQGGQNTLVSVGMDKQAACQQSRDGKAYDLQECEAINFLSRNRAERPLYTIDAENDPLITNSRTVINNPGPVPGTSTQQCRVVRTPTRATFISEICREIHTTEIMNCKRVLRVACDMTRDGCDQGGIVPNTWEGDMATSFSPDGSGNFILQFGTIADDYWRGWGTVFDRNLKFEIKDVDLITRFALTKAAFDDWLMVKVNDHLVYVGPRGGDRLEIHAPSPVLETSASRACQSLGSSWSCQDRQRPGARDGGTLNVARYASCTAAPEGWRCTPVDSRTGMVRYCETCFSGPELSTSWNFDLNVDLKPYLRNGVNTIFMRTIVARGGEGAIQITTRQLCPPTCRDTWDDSMCLPLQQRAEP